MLRARLIDLALAKLMFHSKAEVLWEASCNCAFEAVLCQLVNFVSKFVS